MPRIDPSRQVSMFPPSIIAFRNQKCPQIKFSSKFCQKLTKINVSLTSIPFGMPIGMEGPSPYMNLAGQYSIGLGQAQYGPGARAAPGPGRHVFAQEPFSETVS